MAQYTNIAVQTVPVAGNVAFNAEPVRGTPAIMHRDGSGIVTLRGCTDQCKARYKVTFGANIAVPTGETVGPISLAIALEGEALGGATVISTPAAVEEYNNVFTAASVPTTAIRPRGIILATVQDTWNLPAKRGARALRA